MSNLMSKLSVFSAISLSSVGAIATTYSPLSFLELDSSNSINFNLSERAPTSHLSLSSSGDSLEIVSSFSEGVTYVNDEFSADLFEGFPELKTQAEEGDIKLNFKAHNFSEDAFVDAIDFEAWLKFLGK